MTPYQEKMTPVQSSELTYWQVFKFWMGCLLIAIIFLTAIDLLEKALP